MAYTLFFIEKELFVRFKLIFDKHYATKFKIIVQFIYVVFVPY